MAKSNEFRVPFTCDCGANIVCKTRIAGRTKACPSCNKSFVVPHPGLQFWHVWEYAEAIHPTPKVFLSEVRQILRTLMDIQLFASSRSDNQPSEERAEVVAALQRLSKGPSFGGYTSPHLLQTNWQSRDFSKAAVPPVVSFVSDSIVAIRELKRIMTEPPSSSQTNC